MGCGASSASKVEGAEELGPWIDAGISKEAYDHIVAEFAYLDANGDHNLSRKEFLKATGLPEFLGMTPYDIEHLFDGVDADHNGAISLNEFVAYMSKRKDHYPLEAQRTPQHERLRRNLQLYGFELCRTDGGLKGVKGDGNCQFYSISWGVHSTTSKHLDVRSMVIEYLRGPGGADLEAFYAPDHPTQPQTFQAYLEYMAKNGTWGDHITLQAAADTMGLRVRLVTADQLSNFGAPVMDVSAQKKKDNTGKRKTIWMAFAAQHYSPIQPTARTPKDLLRGPSRLPRLITPNDYRSGRRPTGVRNVAPRSSGADVRLQRLVSPDDNSSPSTVHGANAQSARRRHRCGSFLCAPWCV